MQDGTGDTIGVYLQRERMKRNIGLQDIADATGISLGVLKALEEEDKAKLPSAVYVKAFYKKYADFLGLATAEVAVPPLKSPDESSYDKPIRLLLIIILVAFCGVFFYWAYSAEFNPMQFFGNLLGILELHEPGLSNVG